MRRFKQKFSMILGLLLSGLLLFSACQKDKKKKKVRHSETIPTVSVSQIESLVKGTDAEGHEILPMENKDGLFVAQMLFLEARKWVNQLSHRSSSRARSLEVSNPLGFPVSLDSSSILNQTFDCPVNGSMTPRVPIEEGKSVSEMEVPEYVVLTFENCYLQRHLAIMGEIRVQVRTSFPDTSEFSTVQGEVEVEILSDEGMAVFLNEQLYGFTYRHSHFLGWSENSWDMSQELFFSMPDIGLPPELSHIDCKLSIESSRSEVRVFGAEDLWNLSCEGEHGFNSSYSAQTASPTTEITFGESIQSEVEQGHRYHVTIPPLSNPMSGAGYRLTISDVSLVGDTPTLGEMAYFTVDIADDWGAVANCQTSLLLSHAEGNTSCELNLWPGEFEVTVMNRSSILGTSPRFSFTMLFDEASPEVSIIDSVDPYLPGALQVEEYGMMYDPINMSFSSNDGSSDFIDPVDDTGLNYSQSYDQGYDGGIYDNANFDSSQSYDQGYDGGIYDSVDVGQEHENNFYDAIDSSTAPESEPSPEESQSASSSFFIEIGSNTEFNPYAVRSGPLYRGSLSDQQEVYLSFQTSWAGDYTISVSHLSHDVSWSLFPEHAWHVENRIHLCNQRSAQDTDLTELCVVRLNENTKYHLKVTGLQSGLSLFDLLIQGDPVFYDFNAPVISNGDSLDLRYNESSEEWVLNWNAATDHQTEQAELKYHIYHHRQPRINHLAEINLTPDSRIDTVVGTTEYRDLQLLATQSNYLNVVVEDEQGNRRAYSMYTQNALGGALDILGHDLVLYDSLTRDSWDIYWNPTQGEGDIVYSVYLAENANVRLHSNNLSQYIPSYTTAETRLTLTDLRQDRYYYIHVVGEDSEGNHSFYVPLKYYHYTQGLYHFYGLDQASQGFTDPSWNGQAGFIDSMELLPEDQREILRFYDTQSSELISPNWTDGRFGSVGKSVLLSDRVGAQFLAQRDASQDVSTVQTPGFRRPQCFADEMGALVFGWFKLTGVSDASELRPLMNLHSESAPELGWTLFQTAAGFKISLTGLDLLPGSKWRVLTQNYNIPADIIPNSWNAIVVNFINRGGIGWMTLYLNGTRLFETSAQVSYSSSLSTRTTPKFCLALGEVQGSVDELRVMKALEDRGWYGNRTIRIHTAKNFKDSEPLFLPEPVTFPEDTSLSLTQGQAQGQKSLSWQAAQSVNSSEVLDYRVYSVSGSEPRLFREVEERGRPLSAWTSNITSLDILEQDLQDYLVVAVRDAYQRISFYTPLPTSSDHWLRYVYRLDGNAFNALGDEGHAEAVAGVFIEDASRGYVFRQDSYLYSGHLRVPIETLSESDEFTITGWIRLDQSNGKKPLMTFVDEKNNEELINISYQESSRDLRAECEVISEFVYMYGEPPNGSAVVVEQMVASASTEKECLKLYEDASIDPDLTHRWIIPPPNTTSRSERNIVVSTDGDTGGTTEWTPPYGVEWYFFSLTRARQNLIFSLGTSSIFWQDMNIEQKLGASTVLLLGQDTEMGESQVAGDWDDIKIHSKKLSDIEQANLRNSQ